ncbi:MAG: complement resistance protein TraT [Thermodesulfobacteriota bacterium]
MRRMWRRDGWMAVLIIVMAAAACSPIQRSVDYSKMQTDVAMSETIFLTPTDAPKTVYIKTQNTSSYQAATASFQEWVTSNLVSKGYTPVQTVREATYILQANIRYVGEWKDDLTFEGAGTGAVAGALAGIGLGGSRHSTAGGIIGGVVGAGIGFAADMMTRPKTAVAVIDFQLTERLTEDQDIIDQQVSKTTVTTESKTLGGVGSKANAPTTGTSMKSVSSGKVGTKIYTAGVAAKAIQIGLNIDEAMPKLIQMAATQIGGIF